MRIVFLLAVLGASSCSKPSGQEPQTTGRWRAWTDSGDKPGIGIELTRRSDGLRADVYLLDPNKTGDFSAGRRCPTTITGREPGRLALRVEFLPTVVHTMKLQLPDPLPAGEFKGAKQWEDDDGRTEDLLFRPVP